MARPEEMIPLHPGRLYLGGTMTAYGVVHSEPGAILSGIRFKPGGFYHYFGIPMEPAVDTLLEFHNEKLQQLLKEAQPDKLDSWFAHHPITIDKKHNFTTLYTIALHSGGQIPVESLAAEAHVSTRTLERIFRENVGIPPKEFLRIVRFQEVLKQLRQAGTREAATPATEESLLRIAFDLGYYDHAHLTNEFKKYAGILPSELSRFYKTGIAGTQYF
jgi:AraC-like DNA-binding protein